MPRTIADMPTAQSNSWPPAGKHLCLCLGAEKWKSPNKGTAAVMLTWQGGPTGEFNFSDPIFVTEKAISRLALVASRVCDIAKDMAIPDSDKAAAGFLAAYIMAHAKGKRAFVTIETKAEQYMVEKGPDEGKLKTVQRSRVAFAGYDRADIAMPMSSPDAEPPSDEEPPPEASQVPADEDIPF